LVTLPPKEDLTMAVERIAKFLDGYTQP
jgi:hypothetical protein